MTEIADILEEAADAIDTYGWRQGARHEPYETKICLVEAVSGACSLHGENRFRSELKSEIYAHLLDHIFPFPAKRLPQIPKPFRRVRGERLIGWNDYPGRTQVEVTDALRHTAKEIRNADA